MQNIAKLIGGIFAFRFNFIIKLSIIKRNFSEQDDKRYRIRWRFNIKKESIYNSTYAQNIPRMMTDVVPSPTSSSWVRLNSIIDCIHPNNSSIRKLHTKQQLKPYKFHCLMFTNSISSTYGFIKDRGFKIWCLQICLWWRLINKQWLY